MALSNAYCYLETILKDLSWTHEFSLLKSWGSQVVCHFEWLNDYLHLPPYSGQFINNIPYFFQTYLNQMTAIKYIKQLIRYNSKIIIIIITILILTLDQFLYGLYEQKLCRISILKNHRPSTVICEQSLARMCSSRGHIMIERRVYWA